MPYFQPIVTLPYLPSRSSRSARLAASRRSQRGLVTSVEALARLVTSEGGVVPPDRWLPELTCYPTLTRCLIERVVTSTATALAVWDAAGVSERPLDVAVNVPAVTLMHGEVAEGLVQLCAHLGLPSQRLVVEVLEDPASDEVALGAAGGVLREAGLQVAVDDFGVGSSSVERVLRLCPDVVKVDRVFLGGFDADVADVCAPAIRAAVEVAGAVGARVVAEGVTSAGQLGVLSRLGVEAGQGFWWSAPVPAGEVPAVIRSVNTSFGTAAR